MKNLILHTAKREETIDLGRRLGELCEPGMTILLAGDLGAGKTTFTQGIAAGLDIKKNVTSPTFTIMKIYHGRMDLYHIDAYRLEGVSQDLGFEEVMNDDGLTVIEWSDFIGDQIPEEYLRISIKMEEEDKREFCFEPNGREYEELLEKLK